jgi:CRP-like cAMP-binding protein
MSELLKRFTETIRNNVDITDHEAGEIFSRFKPETVPAGSFFVRRLQICDRIGYMESGMIRHYHVYGNEEVTRWMSLENDFVTSMASFIQQRPCTHWLQAVTDCRVWTIDKAEWDELHTRLEVCRILWTRVLEINLIGFEERLFHQLAGDAEQRYHYFRERFPRFLEKVPQKYIASMIGIKPESLSRLRSRISNKRVS